jgi:hypothetical protein
MLTDLNTTWQIGGDLWSMQPNLTQVAPLIHSEEEGALLRHVGVDTASYPRTLPRPYAGSGVFVDIRPGAAHRASLAFDRISIYQQTDAFLAVVALSASEHEGDAWRELKAAMAKARRKNKMVSSKLLCLSPRRVPVTISSLGSPGSGANPALTCAGGPLAVGW